MTKYITTTSQTSINTKVFPREGERFWITLTLHCFKIFNQLFLCSFRWPLHTCSTGSREPRCLWRRMPGPYVQAMKLHFFHFFTQSFFQVAVYQPICIVMPASSSLPHIDECRFHPLPQLAPEKKSPSVYRMSRFAWFACTKKIIPQVWALWESTLHSEERVLN